ncbi:hypothetical protein ACWDE0_43660 [Streptomyces sp. 900105755]
MLARHLKRVGVDVRGTRNLALLDVAAELPASVASKLLGLSLTSATRWTATAGAHRAAYAADLARR